MFGKNIPTTSDFDDKIKHLANLMSKETKERMTQQGLLNIVATHGNVKVIYGQKYVKLDIDGSGRLMVDKSTEEIFGIKAYGQVHTGHRYGTLDTIDQYFWGDYSPTLKSNMRARKQVQTQSASNDVHEPSVSSTITKKQEDEWQKRFDANVSDKW